MGDERKESWLNLGDGPGSKEDSRFTYWFDWAWFSKACQLPGRPASAAALLLQIRNLRSCREPDGWIVCRGRWVADAGLNGKSLRRELDVLAKGELIETRCKRGARPRVRFLAPPASGSDDGLLEGGEDTS